MLQRFRQSLRTSKSLAILVYGIVSVGLFLVILYAIWAHGTYTILDIPLQIMLITIVLPLALAFMLFRFAAKLDDLAWRSNDE